MSSSSENGGTHGSGSLSTPGRRAAAAALAVTVGFSGAAAIDTLLLSPAAVASVDDFGPGDGLTRLVVSLPGGVSAEQIAALAALPAVDSAQALSDGTALVAGSAITPADLRSVLPGAEVMPSVPGTVAGQAVSDPYWQTYGWNLDNNGANSQGERAVVGADVSAPTGWQAGTGRGMVVAVIDTGYAPSHPDMADALWTNPDESCGATDVDGNGKAGDCHGWNFYRNSADVANTGGDSSHGTAVSGLVAARAGNGQGSAGVAPDVTIMPLVVGGGRELDTLLGAEAIRYAADNGADVINASWGTVQDSAYAATALSGAIAYAGSKGAVVVAAAGNDAADRDTVRRYPASLDNDNLVTVGSSTAADGVAGHSAFGARTVDLFAPGQNVLVHTPDGGYRTGAGTSYAAPQVAAAVALYRAHDLDATPAEVRAQVLADVQYLPAFSGRSTTGGRLSLDDLGNSAAPVRYTFSSMTGDAGVLSPQVVADGLPAGGEYDVRLGLGMEHQGRVYALAGEDISVEGSTVPTDDNGEAAFSLAPPSGAGSVVLTPTLDLREGRYVLTAQVFRDGSALGLAYAAPLLVGDEARRTAPKAPDGGQTPGTPVPTSPAPGPGPGPAPGGSVPAPGTAPRPTAPLPSTPSPAPGTSPRPTVPVPTTTAPVPLPTSPAPTRPGDPTGPEVPEGTDGEQPGNEPDTDAAPTLPAPVGGPAPAPTPSPRPGTPVPVPPTTGSPAPTGPAPAPPGAPAPDTGGRKDYPEEGPARLTSISPTRVSTVGDTRVVITGLAIPAGARVRVGATREMRVTETSSTRLAFTAEPLVAGAYDVHVFGPGGEVSVLREGLTYVPPNGTSMPPPVDGGQQPGTTTPVNPTPVNPTPSNPTPPAGGPGGGGSNVVAGPNGERLVYSSRFASLGSSIWGVNCADGCSGLAL